MISEKLRKHLEKLSKSKIGTHCSDVTKLKISKANKGKKPFLGKKHSEETLTKMRDKVFTKEHRRKIGLSRKKYIRENNPSWKGGRNKRSDGYIEIRIYPDTPFCEMLKKKKRKYIQEHRLIMAKHLGRCLYPYEIVHHKNGIKDDNRIDNLELLPNNNVHNKQIQKVYLENQRLEKEIINLRLKLIEYENSLIMQ